MDILSITNNRFLKKNRIREIQEGTLDYIPDISLLDLSVNNISLIHQDAFRNTKLALLDLSNNPTTFIDKATLRTLHYLQALRLVNTSLDIVPSALIEGKHIIVDLATSHQPPKLTNLNFYVYSSLPYAGYSCWYDPVTYATCIPCPLGTFFLDLQCIPCPPGGFYQDNMAQTGIISHGLGCKTCPPGRYVSPEAAPGKTESECTGCPQGTDLSQLAGFRACPCLKEFYRFERFGACFKCPPSGLKCHNESVMLEKGFYWKWETEENRLLYQNVTKSLMIFTNSYDRRYKAYNQSFPKVYACPLAVSCLGGMESTCASGYKGPLCAVCSKGFYKMLSSCEKCPSLTWLVAQICLVVATISLIAVPVALGKNVKNKDGRSLTDIVLARLKIVIGFYQVTSGTLNTFSYIQWPIALMQILKYAEFLQLNLLRIAPVNCFSNSMQVTSYTGLVLFTAIATTTPLIAITFYQLKKCYLQKWTTFDLDASLVLLSSLKEKCYRVVFLLLFVIYPAACTQILQILPPACHKICVDTKEHSCKSFLRSDYSLKCYSIEYAKYVVIAFCMVAFVVGYPIITLFLIWKHHHNTFEDGDSPSQRHEENEVYAGISFLFENYTDNCWFWEVLELARKVILTSVLILIGGESRTNIGTAAVVSGLYAVLYASFKPISDRFEYWLQLISLMGSCATMNMGMLLKIPEQDISSGLKSEEGSVAITVLLVLVNVMVTAMVVVKYCISFGSVAQKVRRNPKCDVECCLSAMMTLNEASAEMGGIEQEDGLSREVLQECLFEAPVLKSSIGDLIDMENEADVKTHSPETVKQ